MREFKCQNKFKRKMSNDKTLFSLFIICALVLFYHLCFGICHLSYAQESSKEEEALFVARKAYEDGFYEVSLGLIERFLKNYPTSAKQAEANFLIGQCYFHQNRLPDALAKFEGLLVQPQALDIKDALLYWIAEVHFKGNSFNAAANFYKKIIDNFPKSTYLAASLYSLGWCLFQEHEFTQALQYFKIVEERYPKEQFGSDAPFKVIECLYNLKDYAGLKERSKSYLKIYSKDAYRLSYLYFYMAEADYYLNNFNEAINGYSFVLKNNRDARMQALSRLGMSWSYLKLKRYREAESSLLEVRIDDLEKRSQDILLLGKAILMAETNRVFEARKIYDELLNTTGNELVSVQASLGKADAFYNLAEYPEAINVYKQALEKFKGASLPQELMDKLHYGLAWAYLKQGEFKEAIKEFQSIAKTSEDKTVKVSALCQIGDAYQDSGDYNKAKDAYDTILKDYPDSIYGDYVQYQLGLTLLKDSNYEGAVMSFLALKRNFPESMLLDDASYALGLAYFQRQDYNSSREIFQNFQDVFRDSNLKPQALYLLGSSLYNLGDFTKAIEAFKNITRIYSFDTGLVQKAEYEIADCFYQMGNEKEAMSRFKMLRSKYPDSNLTSEILWWLGQYYYRRNEFELARRYFSSLIQDFPKSNLVVDAYYAIGSTFEDEYRHENAIENFRKVIELGKSDLSGQAAIAIADIYVKLGRTDAAISSYRDILRAYPNLTNLIYPKMAGVYYETNNLAEALDYYRKCLDAAPVKEMAGIQIKIAEALQAQGKIDEAIEEYLKVIYLYSDKNGLAVNALLRVAQIYEGRENFKEALNIYKRIISMNVEEAKYAKERVDWIKTRLK
jgi:TolA-binding protein